MSCHHCVLAVRQALSELDGVDVTDCGIGTATVDVGDETVTEARLAAALEEEGYKLESVARIYPNRAC